MISPESGHSFGHANGESRRIPDAPLSPATFLRLATVVLFMAFCRISPDFNCSETSAERLWSET
jgi:hypothetical protein